MTDLPDAKWLIKVNRAVGSTVYFGPFDSWNKAIAWADAVRIAGMVIPMHPPVEEGEIDWVGDRLEEAAERSSKQCCGHCVPEPGGQCDGCPEH